VRLLCLIALVVMVGLAEEMQESLEKEEKESPSQLQTVVVSLFVSYSGCNRVHCETNGTGLEA